MGLEMFVNDKVKFSFKFYYFIFYEKYIIYFIIFFNCIDNLVHLH